jgi:hypothetical protein
MKHKRIWRNMAELGDMIAKLEDKDVMLAFYRDRQAYLQELISQLMVTSRRKQWLLEQAETERDKAIKEVVHRKLMNCSDKWKRKYYAENDAYRDLFDQLSKLEARENLMDSARSLAEEIDAVALIPSDVTQWQKNEMLALANRITGIKDWLSATSERVDRIEDALKPIPALDTPPVPVSAWDGVERRAWGGGCEWKRRDHDRDRRKVQWGTRGMRAAGIIVHRVATSARRIGVDDRRAKVQGNATPKCPTCEGDGWRKGEVPSYDNYGNQVGSKPCPTCRPIEKWLTPQKYNAPQHGSDCPICFKKNAIIVNDGGEAHCYTCGKDWPV